LKEYPEAKIHVCQLDLLNKTSQESAKNFIQEKFGKISVLVNNAGFAYNKDSEASDLDQAEDTLAVNYFGTIEFTKLMLPIVSDRVIFISSLCSDTSFAACSDKIKNKIKSGNLSCDEVDLMANDFLSKVKTGGFQDFYPNHFYGMSKLLVRCYAEALAREATEISVFSCCPGWCRTDMAGWERPTKSAEEGSDNPAWLVITDDDKVVANSGGYFRKYREKTEWGYVWEG